MSQSADVSRSRPFYAARADVYDLLVTDPVEPWVSAVHARLHAVGRAGGRVLEAGCGTGRHAEALIAAGFDVELADAAPELLRLAAMRCPGAAARLVDLCRLAPNPSFDGVTCRGVLNDLLDDGERREALVSLAGQLAPGGVLFLDVRDREASRLRADGAQRRREIDLPDGGSLIFMSRSSWSDGRLVVHEEHAIRDRHGARRSHDAYDFTMRPWDHAELTERLKVAGLTDVSILPGVGRRTSDRRFVTAVRLGA